MGKPTYALTGNILVNFKKNHWYKYMGKDCHQQETVLNMPYWSESQNCYWRGSHESLYLDNSFISKGLQKRKKNLKSLFAQYLEEYDPSAQLTPLVIKRVYEAEQLKIIHNSCYMGIWQIFSLASVLQHGVISVYPSYGG